MKKKCKSKYKQGNGKVTRCVLEEGHKGLHSLLSDSNFAGEFEE
jgi:hypothetical protein